RSPVIRAAPPRVVTRDGPTQGGSLCRRHGPELEARPGDRRRRDASICDGRAPAASGGGDGAGARHADMATVLARRVGGYETAYPDRIVRPARRTAALAVAGIFPPRESSAATSVGTHRARQPRRCELQGRH